MKRLFNIIATRNSLVALAIASCVILPICDSDESTSSYKEKSIWQEIKDDKNICPSALEYFQNSRHVKDCDTVNFPKKNDTLNDKNVKTFLCIGIYDRLLSLCYAGSVAPPGDNVYGSDLDVDMNENLLKDETDVPSFCQRWNNHSHTLYDYEKIKFYVRQLNEATKKLTLCLKLCAKFDEGLEPLCAFLALMDDLSTKAAIARAPSLVNDQGRQTDGSATKNSGKIKFVAEEEKNTKNVETAEHGETESSKNEGKYAPQVSVTMQKTATNAAGSADLSSPLQPLNTDELEKKKIFQSGEPKEASSAVAVPSPPRIGDKTGAEKSNQEKIKKTDNTAQERPKSLPDDGKIANKSVDSPKAGLTDSSGVAVDPARSNRKDSHEVPEKISSLGKERGDQSTDVISEHTQDLDLLAGGVDFSENGSEIESPILPIPGDEANENPAQVSEKRDYVPRMSGFRNIDNEDSHFFSYFTVIGVICIAGYVGYHNKQKIMAMVLEGRRSRGGRGRRRPSTANYRKLDCTLEEAVTSQCNSNVTHVIY